jgi:hypothetical protein
VKEFKVTKDMIGTCITTTEDYLVYKKVKCSRGFSTLRGIAVLLIPTGSKIVIPNSYFLKSTNVHSRKLRTNRAICMGILPFENRRYQMMTDKDKFYSIHDWSYKYHAGKLLRPSCKFEDDTSNACKSGIHFLETEKLAKKY